MHRAEIRRFTLPGLLVIGQFLVNQISFGTMGDGSNLEVISSNAVVEFDRPADLPAYLLGGMPLGNGRLGAMVNGDPHTEIILLNHERIRPIQYREKEVAVSDQLDLVRKLASQGNWPEAQVAFDRMAYGTGGQRNINVFHPAARLIVESKNMDAVSEYRRHLDLEKGVSQVRFQDGGVEFERTTFVSAPHNRIVMRMEGSQPGSISCSIALARSATPECDLDYRAEANPAKVAMRGIYRSGLQFEITVHVISEGGTVAVDQTSNYGPGLLAGDVQAPRACLAVSQADSLTIQVEITVEGRSTLSDADDSEPDNTRLVSYKQLLSAHLGDYREHFRPIRIRLSGRDRIEPSSVTAERLVLDARRSGAAASPRLYELIFHTGRHLLFSSSRRGTLAPHLQGIWSGSFDPAWQARYQFDLNVQFNHWPADPTGLFECDLPLFDLLESLIPQGRRFAKDMYGFRGILFPVASDGLNVRYPTMLETPAIAGWMARHFWEHYLYTLDEAFLRNRAYPFMKEVEAFFDDYLFRGKDEVILILPSGSPENHPKNREGRLVVNSTFDLAVIQDLYNNLTAASILLGVDSSRRPIWRRILEDLPDWPIDADGALREWGESEAQDNQNHRHLGHLYALFPGDLFTPEENPELVHAAFLAMQKREAAFQTDAASFTYVWLASLYARAELGDEALRCLTTYAQGFINPDSFLPALSDLSGQGLGRTRHGFLFQMEAAPAATMAISEMLLQSHGNLLRLLPALPTDWDSGEVSGLQARGGFQVDLTWKEQHLQRAVIRSSVDGVCRFRIGRPPTGDIQVFDDSESVELRRSGSGIYSFEARKGRSYTLAGRNQP
jgi:alpha-L-fucosidase 2